jgi:hypothetical protein
MRVKAIPATALITLAGCVSTKGPGRVATIEHPAPLAVIPPQKPFSSLKQAVERGALDSRVFGEMQKTGAASGLLIIDHTDIVAKVAEPGTAETQKRAAIGGLRPEVLRRAYGARKSAALSHAAVRRPWGRSFSSLN